MWLQGLCSLSLRGTAQAGRVTPGRLLRILTPAESDSGDSGSPAPMGLQWAFMEIRHPHRGQPALSKCGGPELRVCHAWEPTTSPRQGGRNPGRQISKLQEWL